MWKKNILDILESEDIFFGKWDIVEKWVPISEMRMLLNIKDIFVKYWNVWKRGQFWKDSIFVGKSGDIIEN